MQILLTLVILINCLDQVGQQDLYFGVQFCATAVLDIVEHLGGLPREMSFMIGYNPNNGWKDGDLFPCPELSASGAPRDIAFSLVDGDFQVLPRPIVEVCVKPVIAPV